MRYIRNQSIIFICYSIFFKFYSFHFTKHIIQILAMYSVVFWVYKSFGLSEFSFFSIISLQSILSIAVLSLPLPGAVGVSEGSFMILFKTLFPVSILTSAMILNRGISFYIFLIISGGVSAYACVISQYQEVAGKPTPFKVTGVS